MVTQSKNILSFMELKDHLFSEETATEPSASLLNPVPTLTPYFFKIHFNIILLFTLRSSKLCLPFRFSD